MTQQEKINVEIYDQRYTLRVTTEELERVRSIAGHVDAMMHQIGDSQPRLDYRDVAVLAAMNITEELYKLQQEHQQLLDFLEEAR